VTAGAIVVPVGVRTVAGVWVGADVVARDVAATTVHGVVTTSRGGSDATHDW
jgi:hypothetical protein